MASKQLSNFGLFAMGAACMAVIGTGTAVAATGQIVNIADGTNASYVAKVDSSGALKVADVPAAPSKPFLSDGSVYNYATVSDYGSLFAPTTAAVALNKIVISNEVNEQVARQVTVYYTTVDAGQSCSGASNNLYVKRLGTYALAANATIVDTFPTPIVLKPTSSRPWCLLVYARSQTATTYTFQVSVAGWVVYGTPPSGTTM